MKSYFKGYRDWLENELKEEIKKPRCYKNYMMVSGIVNAINSIDEMSEHYNDESEYLTREMVDNWNKKMENEDGTTGGHWTLEQTNEVAKNVGIDFEHISDYCFNVAMNMMYSDYYAVANNYNVNTPKFYADMAKAFLFDKDGGKPSQKIYSYYNYIAK